ncbi:Hypothetical protein R9X50_00609200 [Acrodontium crateriforme]|uniref:RRM domain-containing protein n=1 Tax=Acrodontium crateriforme TaxID=150365 RepID=A0AAQ3M949_9PEZI|nr:Hypothetical protein R9X50_00609200 [Acrodontium crateriforme]
MDRSLDEIISERPSANRGGRNNNNRSDREPRRGGQLPRGPRREEYPRDGIRKNRRDERTNIDSDWVHDRYEDERYDRQSRRGPRDDDRYEAPSRSGENAGAKVRVDNVHYDLTEEDLRGLFEQKGPTQSVRLLYDRMDRSQGTAFVTFFELRDAHRAIADFDGQIALGQPIRLTLVPNAPARAPAGLSLFDRMEKPERSLFDRMGGDDRDPPRRRNRSESPRRNRPAPENIDRYVPGRRASRSPPRRRGGARGGREAGRRPGQRREGGGRGPRQPKTDEDGRPMVGGRPKKTAEELDAEMADYFNKSNDGAVSAPNSNGAAAKNGAAAQATTVADDDIDMAL